MKVFDLGNGCLASADYNKRTGVLDIRTFECVAPLLEENRKLQNDGTNGFTATRQGALGRLIGRPSASKYRQWQLEFERIGGKNQAKWTDDWRKFLRKKLEGDQESRTVAKLVSETANAGHILVR